LLRTARRSTHSSSPSQHGGALTVLPSKAVGRYSYQLVLTQSFNRTSIG
jgi:hypothetical protein